MSSPRIPHPFRGYHEVDLNPITETVIGAAAQEGSAAVSILLS